MTTWLALADYSDGNRSVEAGMLLDDALIDVARMQAGGLAAIVYNPVTMDGSIRAFFAQRGGTTRPTIPEGDLLAILIAAGAIGGGGGGGVSSVTGTPPIASSGGANPAISIAPATGASAGSMSAADKTKLDGIEAGADVTDAANVAAAGAVMESDFSVAHTVLVQQSGTGSPSLVALGTNEILGRQSGGGSAIEGLSATQARAVIGVDEAGAATGVRETSGPTTLAMGAVADGQGLRRVGATVAGYDLPAQPSYPATIGGTTRTLDQADNQARLRFTAATTVTVTVPSLAQGTIVVLRQEGAGQVQLSASGVTLSHPATFLPRAAEQNSVIVLEWITTTLVQVVGDLELA